MHPMFVGSFFVIHVVLYLMDPTIDLHAFYSSSTVAYERDSTYLGENNMQVRCAVENQDPLFCIKSSFVAIYLTSSRQIF